jgi:hypothetical protein
VATAAEVEALRQRLAYDTPFFAANCLWIVNKQRQLQRLKPLPWQARTEDTPATITPIDEALEKQRAAGMPMRLIIGKARKLGCSTWVQAKGFQRVAQLPFQNMLTVAHDRPASAELSDMGLLMYERLPSDPMLADLIYGEGTTKGAPFSVKPQKISSGTSRNGTRFLELGQKMRPAEKSIYRTMTAGSKGGGRASTPNIVHASEVAHWEDPDYLIGLFNALPLEPETIGVVESTAKGFNHFWKLWELAVRGAEDPDTGAVWTPVFYGWQHNPYNALKFITDQGRERFERTIGDVDGGGDPEEVELVENFGVTLEQLNWRRAIINGPEGGGSTEWFHQEHPATPEQMFIGSGTPVFPGILVSRAIRAAEAAPRAVEGVLRGFDWRDRRTRAGSIRVPHRVAWVARDAIEQEDLQVWGSERLLVWEHPLNEATQAGLALDKRKPDGQYVVFSDIAVGEGGTASEGDWHAVQVLDHITRQQVARYRSRIPVHDLPLVLFMIARYFNGAWLAPEINGPGQGVIDALNADYGYSPIYRRHRSGDDQRNDAKNYLLGWQTSQPSKYLMEQTFGSALSEGWHGLRDVATAREFSTYVRDPKRPTSHGAQPGAHDDLAISFMGAHRVAAELRPRDPDKKKRDRWSPRDDITAY